MVHDEVEALHKPVLCDEVMSFLKPEEGGVFIDATVGLGGHALRILRAGKNTRLLGIDKDAEALNLADDHLREYKGRYQLVHSNFIEVAEVASFRGVNRCQGVLADLGVSSLQIDSAERGFSIQREGPLDMRMDRQAVLTASEVVNQYQERDLANLIFNYGDEPRSRAIARAIVQARPIRTTKALAGIVSRAVRARGHRRIHPATKTFQALRIFVNDELSRIPQFIQSAVELLAPGGRIVLISFHSAEDRLVKESFKALSRECNCPSPVQACHCGNRKLIHIITKKPLVPTREEVERNPRARSAKLRVAERI